MTELTSGLKTWGADPESAIHRMVDDEQFYIELLKKFIKKQEWELLRAAVLEKDYEEAFRLAHDIKGNVSVLSLTPLYDAVSPVVEELREGEPDSEFREDMERFIREIDVLKKIVSAG